MVEEDKSLVIKKLRMEDTGMYQCLATNEAGSDYVSTWLKVKSEYQHIVSRQYVLQSFLSVAINTLLYLNFIEPVCTNICKIWKVQTFVC